MTKNIIPYFSIIIPTYNRASIISATIKSVIGQNFENWECIIIDDGSTDNTKHVVSKFINNDQRIKYIFQKNQERSVARNKGIAEAKSNYICFLDSDDYFLENHLETFYNYLNNNENLECMVFTNSILENQENKKSKKIVPLFNEDTKYSYLLKYTPNPARVCISKSILNKFKFDKNISGLEDLDLWLRIATKYKIAHIETYTNIYNIHDEMYSLGGEKRYRKELELFQYVFNKSILKKELPLKSKNRLLSMCYFHLAIHDDRNKKSFSAIKNAFKSYFLFPKGYNGKTNKILLVTVIYNIPIIGSMIKKIKN